MDIVEKLIVLRDIGISNRSDRELIADAANEISRMRNALRRIATQPFVEENIEKIALEALGDEPSVGEKS